VQGHRHAAKVEAGPMTTPPIPAPVVFYDGTCGLCSRLVRALLAADRHGVLRFAPLQGPTAAGLRAAHPEIPPGLDSLLLLERDARGRERVTWRSAAAFRLAALVGGPWRALGWLRVLPRALTDAAYDLVAHSRHRLAGPPDPACPLATPEVAARFLP